MTTDEKLQHFYDFSIETADKEAKEMLKEYKIALDHIFQEHKDTKHRQAQNLLDDEVKKIRRDFNKQLSSEQLTIKRTLSKKHNELKDKLFQEVQNKLIAFKETNEYYTYLLNKMNDALQFADGDPLTIYITKNDALLAENLSKDINHPVCIATEDFLGGIRAEISSKNILIDNSFVTLLKEEKEQFAFTGGNLNE